MRMPYQQHWSKKVRLFLIATVVALMAFARVADAAVKVTVDVNDPNAPHGVAREFSGNGLTLKSLKAKVGRLKRGQVVGIWCEGPGMGADGTSAFDVIVDGEIAPDVRKLNVGESARLEDVCEADAKAFRSRR